MGLTDHLEQRTDLGQDENNYVVYEPIERFEEFYRTRSRHGNSGGT